MLGPWYFLARNWERIAIGLGGLGLGWQPTRAATWTIIKWAGTNVAKPIMAGVATAALNVARAVLLPFATGYTIGAVTTVFISDAIWGETGREDAIELYTGQVSWDDYWNTLAEGAAVLMD